MRVPNNLKNIIMIRGQITEWKLFNTFSFDYKQIITLIKKKKKYLSFGSK